MENDPEFRDYKIDNINNNTGNIRNKKAKAPMPPIENVPHVRSNPLKESEPAQASHFERVFAIDDDSGSFPSFEAEHSTADEQVEKELNSNFIFGGKKFWTLNLQIHSIIHVASIHQNTNACILM